MAAAARIAGVTLCGAVAAGCGGPRCANQAFFGLPSPDGAAIAFVFHRRCEAPAASTTDVSILDFHSSLRNEPGNVLEVNGEQPVRVAWLDPKRLRVTGFDSPAAVSHARLGGFAVDFTPRGDANGPPGAVHR